MRSLTIAAAGLALVATGGAAAQRGAGADTAVGTPPGTTFDAPPTVSAATARRAGEPSPWRPQSWQRPAIAGRPVAADAASTRMERDVYRRPYRGYALPPSRMGPRFVVSDWRVYGLTPPLPGYRWVRYYDDAVLVDARGSVFDTRFDVDWTRRADGADDGARFVRDVVTPDVVASDASADEEAPPPPIVRGRRYRVPVAPEYAPPPPPGYRRDGAGWRSPDGTTTITTTTGEGYTDGGYYRPGATTTTIVVQAAPAVTTTTTETIEDVVAPAGRPIVRRRVRRTIR